MTQTYRGKHLVKDWLTASESGSVMVQNVAAAGRHGAKALVESLYVETIMRQTEKRGERSS